MKLLYTYLRNYWGLVALALTLAAINQVFSLLDPLILRHVIDEYATRFQEYSTSTIRTRSPFTPAVPATARAPIPVGAALA